MGQVVDTTGTNRTQESCLRINVKLQRAPPGIVFLRLSCFSFQNKKITFKALRIKAGPGKVPFFGVGADNLPDIDVVRLIEIQYPAKTMADARRGGGGWREVRRVPDPAPTAGAEAKTALPCFKDL